MIPLSSTLLSKTPIDADMVRHLHAEDPFFRARADRYALLDEEIHAQERAADPPGKYIKMLKKRRELILLELVDIIAAATPETQDPLWKIPATRQPAPARSWRWP